MIRTAILEFFSRGLLWMRILVISQYMPADLYGYLILLVSFEALFGSVISYPQIKDLLLRQDIHPRELSRTFCLYVLLLPIIIGSSWLYFQNLFTTLAVLTSVLFFSISQVLLYLLRISDVRIYNSAKISSALVSTVIFFVILRSTPNLLPVVSGSYALVLLQYYRKKHPFSVTNLYQNVNLSDSIGNWLIFGLQSAITNLGMYGNRFIIGISFPLIDVGTFTKSYMIASGVTFYYAAIMIYYEKYLSKNLCITDLPTRLRLAAKIGVMLIIGLVAYNGFVLLVWKFSTGTNFSGFFETLNSSVYGILVIFFTVQIVYLCINPIVIALERRRFSLLASFSSLLIQALLIFINWSDLSLPLVATIMVLGHTVLVIVLLIGCFWRFKQTPI